MVVPHQNALETQQRSRPHTGRTRAISSAKKNSSGIVREGRFVFSFLFFARARRVCGVRAVEGARHVNAARARRAQSVVREYRTRTNPKCGTPCGEQNQ